LCIKATTAASDSPLGRQFRGEVGERLIVQDVAAEPGGIWTLTTHYLFENVRPFLHPLRSHAIDPQNPDLRFGRNQQYVEKDVSDAFVGLGRL
jgi:hypothetical protein